MPDTNMATAFRKAGLTPAGERLQAVLSSVLQCYPRDQGRARALVLDTIRDDPGMLWEAMAKYRDRAVSELLAVAAARLRLAKQGGGHESHASGAGQTARAPSPLHIAPRSPAGLAAVLAVVERSWLDKLIVNGQPIGDLTPAEAVKWAGGRERDARFVRLLAANLPSDQPIRRYRTAEEANSLYRMAEESAGE